MQEKGEYMINFKQLPDSEKPRERLPSLTVDD